MKQQLDDSGNDLWQQCLKRLERQIPLEELNTWIRPLQLDSSDSRISLSAPNDLVRDQVRQNYLDMIREFFSHHGYQPEAVVIEVGSRRKHRPEAAAAGGAAWGKIGRASCRARVWGGGGAGAVRDTEARSDGR